MADDSTSNAKPLLQAIAGQPVDRYPIWFLRQAGRYLPEYMKVRSKVTFEELCRSPELASEVTLQPLRRYDVDAAIIFSDILIPCVGMGQKLRFDKGHGPQLDPPIRAAADLKQLKVAHSSDDLGFVGEAIVKTKAGLTPSQTMIGFAGAPLTVATYMIEGSGSKTYAETKRLAFSDRALFSNLLEMITATTIDYLKMQIAAGAEYIMLFDTWAACLSAPEFRDQVFPYLSRITDALAEENVPVCYFPGQGSSVFSELSGLTCNVVAIDWRVRLEHALHLLKEAELDVAVQGNLDPMVLMADEQEVRAQTRRVLEAARGAKGHIFNVGHGLTPMTNPEALTWVIDEVRQWD